MRPCTLAEARYILSHVYCVHQRRMDLPLGSGSRRAALLPMRLPRAGRPAAVCRDRDEGGRLAAARERSNPRSGIGSSFAWTRA